MRFLWPYDRTEKSKEIVFKGVAGYHFRDAIGSVIFSLEEKDIEQFLKEHETSFSASFQRFGFPRFWRSNARRTLEELKGLKVWEIGSSIGFEGWIIAQSALEADQDAALNCGRLAPPL